MDDNTYPFKKGGQRQESGTIQPILCLSIR